MFGGGLFTGIPEDVKEHMMMEVQRNLKEEWFHNGKWIADYRRIRVMAIKE